jgi:Bacterial regulatory protein, Fis family
MSEKKQQTYCVYSVNLREGKDNDLIKIGSAFPHLDGKGFDIALEALPVNARLILRESPETERPVGEQLSLAKQVEAFERALIEQCLVESGGNIGAVLDRLDVPRRTLNEKMTRLGIDRRRLASATRPENTDKSVKTGNHLPTRRSFRRATEPPEPVALHQLGTEDDAQ